jgi:hypothetical protein
MIHEYFPAAAMALQEEIANHPALVAILGSLPPSTTLHERVGHIAAYCNVVLDGMYLEEDLEQLFNYLIKRLKNKNEIAIH